MTNIKDIDLIKGLKEALEMFKNCQDQDKKTFLEATIKVIIKELDNRNLYKVIFE